MKTVIALGLMLLLAAPALPVNAEDALAAGQVPTQLPDVELAKLLDNVADNTDKEFLLDYRVPARVVAGTLKDKNIGYGELLVILRNNDLAAVTSENVVSIVPADMVRQYALPMASGTDGNFHDEEWVTEVISLNHAEARSMVPILRPLLPRAGHLAAHPNSNVLIIADRYANVRRIAAVVAELDTESQIQVPAVAAD